jgi:hypothetical protein
VRGKSWCWGDRAVLEKEVTGRGMSDLSESGQGARVSNL